MAKKKRSWMSRHPRVKRVAYTLYAVGAMIPALCFLPLFLLPRRIVYGVGRVCGIWCVYPFLRDKITKNLMYAYGERMTPRRASAIAKKVAINVPWFMIDAVYLWIFARRYDARKTVTRLYGWDTFLTAWDEKKGVIIATIHFSCFEILPVYFNHRFYPPGGVIARSFPSPFLTWLNRRARLRHKLSTYFDDVRGVIRALRQNGLIGILPDLHAKRRLGVPCTFFGKPTLALDVHWRIAAQTGSPVMPCFLVRQKKHPWQYTLLAYPVLHIAPKADATQRAEKVQQLTDVFEQHIRRFPSQWFWFHNKWKIL